LLVIWAPDVALEGDLHRLGAAGKPGGNPFRPIRPVEGQKAGGDCGGW